MSKQKRKILRQGFIKSLPILCSYIFLGAAYGMMMENAGFSCMYSLLASVTVYTGAFQFMLITFLSSGASIATIAISAQPSVLLWTDISRRVPTDGEAEVVYDPDAYR